MYCPDIRKAVTLADCERCDVRDKCETLKDKKAENATSVSGRKQG